MSYNKEYQKKYRERNKDDIKEYQKEYQKKYRERNKDDIKEYQKNYNKSDLTDEQKERYKDVKSQWFKDNREKMKEYQNKKRKENKLKSLEYKGGKCNHCDLIANKNNYPMFDFHHIDESKKNKNPSLLMINAWKTITKELDKCLLLCSNCHRMEHNRLKSLGK